jgi:acetolactate synthase regulatory subunit
VQVVRTNGIRTCTVHMKGAHVHGAFTSFPLNPHSIPAHPTHIHTPTCCRSPPPPPASLSGCSHQWHPHLHCAHEGCSRGAPGRHGDYLSPLHCSTPTITVCLTHPPPPPPGLRFLQVVRTNGIRTCTVHMKDAAGVHQVGMGKGPGETDASTQHSIA